MYLFYAKYPADVKTQLIFKKIYLLSIICIIFAPVKIKEYKL